MKTERFENAFQSKRNSKTYSAFCLHVDGRHFENGA